MPGMQTFQTRIIFSESSSILNPNTISSGIIIRKWTIFLISQGERNYLKRMEIYRKVEEIIMEDAVIVPTINHVFQKVYQPYVRGIEVNALGGPYIPMKKIWLKK